MYCGIASPASRRSLILACAMSRATTSVPDSESLAKWHRRFSVGVNVWPRVEEPRLVGERQL